MSAPTGPRAARIPPELRDEFLQASRYAASDLLLAQGSGGNTSAKSVELGVLWVKASGVRMADISADSGYVHASLTALLDALRDPALEILSPRDAHEESVRRFQLTVAEGQSLRPSLETGFHAVLGRVVLHTHPVYSNAFACMRDGHVALDAALPGETLWVAYAAPGYALGRAVDRACAASGAVSVVLENHGHIASATTAHDAIAMTDRVIAAARATFGEVPEGCTRRLSAPTALANWADELGQALRRRFPESGFTVTPATLGGLAELSSRPERWQSIGALVPDDVVYGPSAILVAQISDSPAAWVERHLAGAPEKLAIIVAGQGVVLVAHNAALARTMEENLLANVLVRTLVERRGTVRTLPREEVEYLQSMESEKYRQKVVGAR
ncbi:MAG: class II aldolase/adducin family protein [Terriglobales bacterium]